MRVPNRNGWIYLPSWWVQIEKRIRDFLNLKQMKILNLTAENVKRLVAVDITPAGDVVVIGGANEAGKSSVLDAIAMTLGGKTLMCDKPLREGAKSGRSSVKLDNGLTVTRTYGATGATAVTITDEHGAKFSGPQGILDKMIGTLTFDPLAFSRLEPAKQADVVRQLAGLDFTKLDALHAGLYQQRTNLNRDVETLKTRRMSAPTHPDAPGELIDTANLLAELEKVHATNRQRMVAQSDLNAHLLAGQSLASKLNEIPLKIKNLKESIKNLQESLAVEERYFDTLTSQLDESRKIYVEKKSAISDEPLDTQSLADQISSAGTVNQKVQDNQAHASLSAELESKEGEVASVNSQMEALTKDKADQITAAKLPIAGLGIEGKAITFNGIPWDQVSTGAQIKISVAIGMAMNPTLKVLLCRDGSLLDPKNMAIMCGMAKEKDYQLWIETCHPDGMQAVIIEDGTVKE